jgi:hypothetical protein
MTVRAFLPLFVLLAACVKPPEIVMVDRATALEQQAAGSFEAIERRLDRAAIEPRPVPFTPEQLASLGMRPASFEDAVGLTDADRVDALLVRRCVGETKDGELAETHDACRGAIDSEEVRATLDGVNRARRQLWRWMHEQHPASAEADLRRGWRAAHVKNLVCGGWLEGEDGVWRAKPC